MPAMNEVCGLVLVVEAAQGASQRLAAGLAAARISSVVIRPPLGQPLPPAEARTLVEMVQAQDVAALIENDARLARTVRADGIHLALEAGLLEAYEEAREILGERHVVGAFVGKSRHDAMTVAERGADFVAFGAPAHAHDREAARARRLALVAWWAEIFEVPCVALDVVSPVEAAELAAAGADFVAVTLEAGLAGAAAGERISAIGLELERRG